MDLGDEMVASDNVIFDYPDNSPLDHRVVINAENDVSFLFQE